MEPVGKKHPAPEQAFSMWGYAPKRSYMRHTPSEGPKNFLRDKLTQALL